MTFHPHFDYTGATALFGADFVSPPLPAKVIRAIVRQFERAGTGALEAKELWQTPEIRELKGLDTLKQAGPPGELLRRTKETLFAA